MLTEDYANILLMLEVNNNNTDLKDEYEQISNANAKTKSSLILLRHGTRGSLQQSVRISLAYTESPGEPPKFMKVR